jgi:hypothetical protein
MSVHRAFSGMTLQLASKLLEGPTMAKLRTTEIPGLVAVGEWQSRRFVVAAFRPADTQIASPRPNVDDATLGFQLSISAAAFVQACRSFGARVERRQRDAHDRFEVVGDFDGVAHTVHAFHHVALCGAKGPWPADGLMRTGCAACRALAFKVPNHRARYHPAA